MNDPHRDERVAFVKAILDGDLETAPGVFADWLDEHGDPRGVLLRRRWRRWPKDREKEIAWQRKLKSWGVEQLELFGPAVEQDPGKPADDSFLRYVREKFHDEYLWIPVDTNSQAYLSS